MNAKDPKKIDPKDLGLDDLPDPFAGGYGGSSSDAGISDEQLDAMLAGSLGALPEESEPEFQAGDKVSGIVLNRREGEVLIELHHKTHGVIDETEFGDEPPHSGDRIEALVVRTDRARDLIILSVSETRKEVMWDELRVGAKLEGVVTAANKGGLTLNIKGARAFMPISHIELHRVEALEPYIGVKFTVEVLSFDRADNDIVVSRRNLLQVAHEEEAAKVVEELHEGQVVDGTVRRVNAHGAFIDVGGTDGLLHTSKIARRQREIGSKGLQEGQQVRVEIVQIDSERNRITLDFHEAAADGWQLVEEEYAPGQVLTTLITEVNDEEARLLIEEGVTGIIAKAQWGDREPQKGSLVKVVITALDAEQKRVLLKFAE